MAIRLICITKEERPGVPPLLCLTEIGGVNEQNGEVRIYNRAELYDVVMKGEHPVYLLDILGGKVKVYGDRTESGEKYLRTTMNEEKADDLLKLSSCSVLK